MSKALRCFLDLGRRKIAYIGWTERQSHDERTLKALDELQECYPVIIRKEWIKSDIYPERLGAGWEEFREIWSSSSEKPDGLIIDNEHLLPDVERVLKELNIKVPQDLVVICHRTRGNERVPRIPVIFQEYDASFYAHRMAEFFLRLYRGEKIASPTIMVPRQLIDDVVRSHPDFSQLRPIWTNSLSV
jgi:DNA-binding LacI/PurR family transcriptional regulator